MAGRDAGVSEMSQVADLLRQAGEDRAAGREDRARAGYLAAADRSRGIGDHDALATAALALAADQRWGEHPGRVPALLHQAYRATADAASRARLAAALVRCWVYGFEVTRATQFAEDAVKLAEESGDQAALADALDAALLVRWGPDDFDARRSIAARLSDVASHLDSVEARMSAHLWRLTVALESLDGVVVSRQLRILDALAAESGSPRIRCFADSRAAMFALVTDRLENARSLTRSAVDAGAAARLADLGALTHSLDAALARHLSDRGALAAEAEGHERHGLEEGIPLIAALGGELWARAGELGRAGGVLDRLAGSGLPDLPRDMEWLPTMAILVRTAAWVGRRELLADGVDTLAPYHARGIVDAGAIMFHGVVSDVLYRACVGLGRGEQARRWRAEAADAYRGLGSQFWLAQLDAPAGGNAPPVVEELVVHLRPTVSGLWLVGADGSSAVVPDVRGLRYLRELIANPGMEVSALELVARSHRQQAGPDSDAGELLDAKAKAAYRRRLAEIEDDLAEARHWSDSARISRVELEREALIEQLGAAVGLAGRHRVAGSNAERARVAVRKAIVAAIDRVGHHDPAVARLLRDCVRTGRVCRYEPDPARPIRWRLD